MILRVSEALRLAGLVDASFYTDAGCARGTAAHTACALFDVDDLDESTVDPVVAPYLAGWKQFRAEMEPEILAIEEAVSHPTYRYRGTLDRRAKVRGEEAILDIKSGARHPSHGIQCAGYAATFARPLARFGVYLTAEGTYRLIRFDDRKDFDVWRAVLTVAHWKKENGLDH